ncbi:hypothetical protein BT96DRAFT_774091, partial [Gymnopus androsaceus JB14]
MGLVLWILIYVKLLADLLAYINDNFSWEFGDNITFYAPYNDYYPTKQTRLLECWDELGIPHDKPKQLWGPSLLIVGFKVDPNTMTITMPLEARSDLLEEIQRFAGVGKHWTLKEYQHLGGWINWSLNVYPLLHPGLLALYEKMAGKSRLNDQIWTNKAVIWELLWFAEKVEILDGMRMLDNEEWGVEEADLVLYCDACPAG